MKHSILLVVSKPDKKDEWEHKLWLSLTTKLLELSSKQIDFELIGENVLLIQLNKSLNPLAVILSEIGDLDYKYAIFDEEIQWHEVANRP
jgi:hypothetical protein